MKSTGRFTPALRKLTHYSYDHCCQCGGVLTKGIAAYAGYTKTGAEVYVGECCLASVSELASHIYWWWTTYKRPAPETGLWRYMSFFKFVALLRDGALYFTRADRLGDHFEGARGLATRKEEWKAYCLDYFRQAIRSAPGQTENIAAELMEEQAERLFRDFEARGEREVKSTYVTCWHANDGESEALWRLYAPPDTAGIALRAEFGALDAALNTTFDVKFGYVQYVDFASRFAGTYDRIFWKRASLSHETEVRGVIAPHMTRSSDETGVLVPLDLSRGIKAVVISPFAPIWFADVVRTTLQKFGIGLSVQPSSLLAEPFF
jgi:hypothetical protein